MKIAKGTPVVFVAPWDLGRGSSPTFTVSVRKMVIQSLGKKQGTATAEEGGKFVLRRIYPSEIGTSIFPAAEATEAAILVVAQGIQAAEIARIERIMAHESFPTYCPGYRQGMADTLVELKKPLLVKSYESLRSKVLA